MVYTYYNKIYIQYKTQHLQTSDSDSLDSILSTILLLFSFIYFTFPSLTYYLLTMTTQTLPIGRLFFTLIYVRKLRFFFAIKTSFFLHSHSHTQDTLVTSHNLYNQGSKICFVVFVFVVVK